MAAVQTQNSGLPALPLADLAKAIDAQVLTSTDAASGDPAAVSVQGISHDSRSVTTGELWVALPGQRTHGARFAEQALGNGPAAVLTDRQGAELVRAADSAVPLLVTEAPRRAMARAAALLMGEPARAMLTFGVTGTNGKTTTAFMIDSCLRTSGRHCGLIGTVGFLLDGEPLTGVRTTTVTTPESPELQRILATLVDSGADAMTMEVSSHALALQRADAIDFDVVGFNNLGIDHLDFHHTVDEYFEAKAQLFTPAHGRRAVINIDDERGRTLADRIRTAGELELTTVSPSGAPADVRVVRATPSGGHGSAVEFDIAGARHEVVVGLPGAHNVANAALAAGMLFAAGLDLAACLPGLSTVRVPGRMEPVVLGSPSTEEDPTTPYVVVDFAHTPTAVGAACSALAESAEGPLVVVVGSGGDRDPAKRAPIGAHAAKNCDILVIADDNPRTEDPAEVRAQVLAGGQQAVAEGARARQVLDGGGRREAVRLALDLARQSATPGHRATVAILGKGHETGQEINGVVHPYTDAGAANEGWAELQSGGDH